MTPQQGAASQSARLCDAHRRQLEVESGIPPGVIAARGYETVTKKVDLKNRGFADSQQIVPALLIPLWNAQGEIGGYQCKPDFPRFKNGKVLKYETPAGMRMLIDVPPAARGLMGNPSMPLVVTEGVKKADCTASRGLCCVALLGVWNWRGKNGDGGMTALADWDYIALKNRQVIIAFDSDVMTKAPVLAAMRRLREFLRSRGATVRICLLQPGPNGEKTGLDDFFVRGGTVPDLMALVQDDLPALAAAEQACEYEERDDGIHWLKPTDDGHQDVLLCNFTARIIREITRTNGVDTTKVIEVEAKTPAGVLRVEMPIEKFGSTNWHLQTLGTRAVVQPGTTPQRLVHAIQTLSDPEVARVHTHTGWTKIGDAYYYLNAGHPIGPLGPLGPLPETRVELPGRLAACALPPPPTNDALRDAAAAMVEGLDVADVQVSYPLLLGACRATLGETDFGLYLEGTTGHRKTAVAAVFQAFFGHAFDARNLPGNWSSTANALEELLFAAKDTVVVIDDFVYSHPNERAAMEAKADRLFRGAANHSGRNRLNANLEQRPDHPPRAFPIATGELLPGNVSLRARMLVLSIGPGTVNLCHLSRLQKAAAEGRLALAMAGLLQWLAPQLDSIRAQLRDRTDALRNDLLAEGWHGRTTTAIAELLVTAEIVGDYLVHARALSPSERDAFVADARTALVQVGSLQGQAQLEVDPVDRYFVLLASLLASGRVHLCCSTKDGQPPANFESACGWSLSSNSPAMLGVWSARGQKAGWLSPTGDVFLLPSVADAAIQQLAREQGEAITLGVSLRKRLDERGKLASTETRGSVRRLTVRRSIGAARHEVVHVQAEALWPAAPSPQEVAQVAHAAGNPCETTSSEGPLGQMHWPNSPAVPPEAAPNPVAESLSGRQQ